MIVVIARAHVAVTYDDIEIGAVASMSFFLEPLFEAIQSPPHPPPIFPLTTTIIVVLITTPTPVQIQSTPRHVIDMIDLVAYAF